MIEEKTMGITTTLKKTYPRKPAPPPHQPHPGPRRARARRATAPAQHRAHTQGRKTPPPRATAPRSVPTSVRFPPAPTGA